MEDIIFSITGNSRQECLQKIARALQGTIGNHIVFNGSSKHIQVNDKVIDITYRKGKVVSYYIWNKDDKKSIRYVVNKEK